MSGKALWETAHTDLSLYLKLLFKHGLPLTWQCYPGNRWTCTYVCLSMCALLWNDLYMCVCVRVCFYGSFKGSKCVGLPFHRMSAVVQLWSTASPYIWNPEKIHQGYSLPLFSGPIFHRFVCVRYVCILGARWCVSKCVCTCMIVRHCVVLSAPNILKLFGSTSCVCVCAVFPGCS